MTCTEFGTAWLGIVMEASVAQVMGPSLASAGIPG